MKLTTFLCTICGITVAALGPAKADGFRIPIADNCHDINVMAPLPPPVVPKYPVNYVVSLRYLDHDKHVVAAPFPFMGSGFIARGNSITRSDFAVQSGNTLQAVPVCTGYAATVLVDPASEAEAQVRVAVEHAYLGKEIMERRLSPPPITAVPVPQSTVIDKTAQMKSGDSTTYTVAGDPEFSFLEVTFTTFNP
ncbi:MAG: hypothetical protein F8N36_14235 [Desulfovibrio sp.]|uniref:hypothetical protein n=1 Tax=Desulfovibrio sp. TaxID=885 RepID=UPI00135EACCA|nr:hypothetical protein [Desulfovibrio sp.]MTJ93997.1 hypothetical protein [Desulfovibrio sp.]